MMAAHKYLHDLLREDQEPFLLNSYISDKRFQLKQKSTPMNQHLVEVKNKQNPNISLNQFGKKSCFFSVQNSPDYKKSPLFEFMKSPVNKSSSNTIFLHIPARTAAVLLEAASRIEKQANAKTRKNHQNKSSSLGLFGSILKRLTKKNKTQNRKINNDVVVNVGRRKITGECEKTQENLMVGFSSCSCNCSLRSSVWSGSNCERSLDTETLSSSTNSDDFGEENGDFADSCSTDFVKSPFHFVLQRSPSSNDCQTPEFSSPATSPMHRKSEEKATKFQEDEIEEEKEQSSPVSVLDPLFDIDEEDEEGEGGYEDCKDENSFNLECSYALVQKAKQQLLQKLRRFEQLSELDPIELEKRMLEDEQEDDKDEGKTDESLSCNESDIADEPNIPAGMKKLVADLIAEEERQDSSFDERDEVVKRVYKRLETFKKGESTNTIDMMVDLDFKTDIDGWKKNDGGQVKMMVMEIELAIFRLMVEELSEDLVC